MIAKANETFSGQGKRLGHAERAAQLKEQLYALQQQASQMQQAQQGQQGGGGQMA